MDGLKSVLSTQKKAFQDPVYQRALVVSLAFTVVVIFAAVSLLVTSQVCKGSKSKKMKKFCKKMETTLVIILALFLALALVVSIITQIIFIKRSPKAFAQRAGFGIFSGFLGFIARSLF